MSTVKPQRRDALLVRAARDDLIIDMQHQGHAWISDRFVMVRADLFKRPPTRFQPGARPSARKILRGFRFADTVECLRVAPEAFDARGRDGAALATFAFGSLLICMNARVADGLTAAGLTPRVVHAAGERQMLAWYHQRNQTQWTLLAITMPVRLHRVGGGWW